MRKVQDKERVSVVWFVISVCGLQLGVGSWSGDLEKSLSNSAISWKEVVSVMKNKVGVCHLDECG